MTEHEKYLDNFSRLYARNWKESRQTTFDSINYGTENIFRFSTAR